MKKKEATCTYCNTELKNHKGSIKSHAKKCDEIQQKAKKFGTSDYFFIRVNSTYTSHWLVIKAHPNLLLSEIDGMLRRGWLECCGHLSEFSIRDRGRYKNFSKDAALSDIFSEYKKIDYIYDFGSSTNLELELLDTVEMPNDGNLVLYLQNKPFDGKCVKCKTKQATKMCIDCMYDDDHCLYCEQCVYEHGHLPDNSDYGFDEAMDLVNSPRTGTCAYMGPVDFSAYQSGNKKVKPKRKNRNRAKDIFEESDEMDFDIMEMLGGGFFEEEEPMGLDPEEILQNPMLQAVVNGVIMQGPGQIGVGLPIILKQLFEFYKQVADRAISQLKNEELFIQLNPHTHSIAALMRHISIVMRSNYEDWENTDIQKYRLPEELEFSATPKEWLKIKRNWDEAWNILLNELEKVGEEGRSLELMNLGDGEDQPIWIRWILSLSHYNYHIGQIVQTAKMISNQWEERVFKD